MDGKPLPLKLYKYQNLRTDPTPDPRNPRIYSIENLRQRSIWLSHPGQLDDPFDCVLPIERKPTADDEALREYKRTHDYMTSRGILQTKDVYLDADGHPTKYLKDVIDKYAKDLYDDLRKRTEATRGIACFSETCDNVLMWACYADGHRGFCLEFDTAIMPFNRAEPVTYADAIPAFSPVEIRENPEKAIRPMLFTKAHIWSYQEEWRFMNPVGGILLPYNPTSLTGVYFGLKIPEATRNEILRIIGTSPVECYDMKKADDEFRLVRVPLYSAY